MKRTLRRESISHLLPRIIACALLTVLFFGLSAKGLFVMLRGPVSLSGENPETMKGDYVSFDASEVIVAFANLTSKSDSGSSTLKTYYLLPAGDGTYLAVMDRKEHHADVMDKAMDQSHEYYLGDLETLTQLGTVSGTAVTLEDDMTGFMVDCIENYQLPGYTEDGDTDALIRPIQINLDQAGLFSTTLTLIFGGAGLLFLLLTLALLIPALTGHYQKKAMAVVLAEHTAEEAEALFKQAETLERVKVGEYLWYQKGATTHAVKVADLIWGYPMPEPLVVSKYRWVVALYDMDQKMIQVCFRNQGDCKKLLDAIAAQRHPFISGYTSDLSQKFQQNFEGFVRAAEKAAKE